MKLKLLGIVCLLAVVHVTSGHRRLRSDRPFIRAFGDLLPDANDQTVMDLFANSTLANVLAEAGDQLSSTTVPQNCGNFTLSNFIISLSYPDSEPRTLADTGLLGNLQMTCQNKGSTLSSILDALSNSSLLANTTLFSGLPDFDNLKNLTAVELLGNWTIPALDTTFADMILNLNNLQPRIANLQPSNSRMFNRILQAIRSRFSRPGITDLRDRIQGAFSRFSGKK